MVEIIVEYIYHIGENQIWINPDCGLKTRKEETVASVRNMVKATQLLRDKKVGN